MTETNKKPVRYTDDWKNIQNYLIRYASAGREQEFKLGKVAYEIKHITTSIKQQDALSDHQQQTGKQTKRLVWATSVLHEYRHNKIKRKINDNFS